MPSTIWGPGGGVPVPSGAGGYSQYSATAIAGQTVFNSFLPLGFTYVPGQFQIEVYINGAFQMTGINYTETNATTITFTSGLEANDIVTVIKRA